MERAPLGFKVIVNNLFEGLIYHNEVFEKVHVGDTKRAFIKYIRDDGKLDISLQKIGVKNSDENSNKVLEVLKNSGGEMSFTYKSDAQDIKNTFSMSKKAFKLALTRLINEKSITLEEDSIKLSLKVRKNN